jgi:hypothetical protein
LEILRVPKPEEHPPVRRNIQLLATVQESDGERTGVRRHFGNIIELGSRALILEANRELQVGAAVTVNMVFPGQPRDDDPLAHLHCTVRKAHDGEMLQYDLTIIDMDARTRGRLQRYLHRGAATGNG